MTEQGAQQAPIKALPNCVKEADKLAIILACDGAASVGQVGHAVAVDLTNSHEEARMCCITAVAAGSKPHVGIAERAKKLIVINGCANRCASKVLEQKGIAYDYETLIVKEGVEKAPTLDFDQADVKRIAAKIAAEALGA